MKELVPPKARSWLRTKRRWLRQRPPTGLVRWGSFKRTAPISRNWGFDRGTPVDRYFIHRFLTQHAKDIRGHVLEIANNTYTGMLGDGVTKVDVLHVEQADEATIVGDLQSAEHIPSDTFDCVVITQTLHVIPRPWAAIETLHRIVKPGGVVLLTCPGITKVSRYDMDRWGDFWRLTSRSLRMMFEEHFAPEELTLEVFGNVSSATAFLHGLAAEELDGAMLEERDPDFEVLLGMRAVKRQAERKL